MKKIFIALLILLGIFVCVSLLQIIGVVPKRCDKLAPCADYKTGKPGIISPCGTHCYGIWDFRFWLRPYYL